MNSDLPEPPPEKIVRVTLHYSEPLVRKAVAVFWWRVTGWRFFGALALVLLSAIALFAIGDRSWVLGVSAAAFGLGALFSIALYTVHIRETLTRFRRMHTPEATFEIGEERFRATSDAGSTELRWSAVTEIWQFPAFWLLFVSRAQFMTLPLADLDAQIRELIASRAKAHGAKIS